MAYDEALAGRVRSAVAAGAGGAFDEKKKFGGLAFMRAGHLVVCVVRDGLIVRTGAEGRAEALRQPHVATMDRAGRSMRGFVVVAAEGLATRRRLESWIDKASRYAASLPPKPA